MVHPFMYVSMTFILTLIETFSCLENVCTSKDSTQDPICETSLIDIVLGSAEFSKGLNLKDSTI